MGYLTNFIVYTLAMVGVMMLALIIFKKSTGGCSSKNSKFLKVLDTMSLGPRKTLYIVSAGDEKFLIAGDADNTTLISKLNPQGNIEERISAIASIEAEDFSTKSFKNVMENIPRKTSYMDKSVVGINADKLNRVGIHDSSQKSVIRNLAEKMNTEIGGAR